MRIYYLNAEYQPERHKIITTWSARFLTPKPEEDANTTINSPYSVIEIDEDWNRSLAKDAATRGLDRFGNLLGKCYIDNPAPPQIHLEATGAIVPITVNPNKADWVASVLAGATDVQIDTWFTNNVTTLAQARTVMAMMAKLIARLARQAGFE